MAFGLVTKHREATSYPLKKWLNETRTLNLACKSHRSVPCTPPKQNSRNITNSI